MNHQVREFLRLLRTPPHSVRAAYDAAAAQYDQYEQIWLKLVGATAVQRVEELVLERLPTAARVLDAGIGTGAMSARILGAGRSPRIIGVDLSIEMLRAARRRLRQRELVLVQADLTNLPFRNASFDAIVSTWVLETLPDPLVAMSELLRLIRPEGFVVCAFSSAATDQLGALEELLLRRPIGSLAGRFLSNAERPMHWCARSSLQHFHHGLTTVIVLGACCTMDEFGPCLPSARASLEGWA